MNLPTPAPKFSFMQPGRAPAIQSTRALDAAARAYSVTCADRVKRIKVDYQKGLVTQWSDLKIDEIPATTSAQPLTFMNLTVFLSQWQATAEARFKLQEQARKVETTAVSTRFEAAAHSTGLERVGRFRLRPRQRKCIDAIVEAFSSKRTQSVICPLEGGEGKSVIGWAIVKYYQDNNWFGHPTGLIPLPNQAIFSTAAAVKIDMAARAHACDVANVNKFVTVISHTELGTKAMAPFFVDDSYEAFGQKIKRLRYIMPPPVVFIIDEFDAFKKPTSKKSLYLAAIIRAGVAAGSVFVWMSATPGVTINDMWAFAISTGRKYNGEQITLENFGIMARGIASRVGASPADNSPRAMAEFRKEFNDCYVVPPRDPRKVKAYNDVLLVDFDCPEDRAFYDRTMARYYDELERVGQGDTTVNKMTSFLKLRQSEEWLKVKYFVKLALAAWREGRAPVIGVCFEATVNEIVRQLVFTHGIPRSKISVIQGGSELITREKLAKIIGPELFDNIGTLILKYYEPENGLAPKERTAVRKYLKWIKERVKFEESEDNQAHRQAELKQLSLGRQTPQQRHAEKERFQNGDTEFMVFTLSSGGRGIDMDQQFEGVRQREGFFTICYWAEEFMQALYRLMRVATLSDVRQHMVFFKGTIVADHVAPRLDKKIKSVRAGVMSGTELADEAIELLSTAAPERHVEQDDLRKGDDTVDDTEGVDIDTIIEDLQKEENAEEDDD